jgi:hypothetical protein
MGREIRRQADRQMMDGFRNRRHILYGFLYLAVQQYSRPYSFAGLRIAVLLIRGENYCGNICQSLALSRLFLPRRTE